MLAIYCLQHLVDRDGGDRGLLGSGGSGIVFKTPKSSVFCILFLGGSLSPSKGVRGSDFDNIPPRTVVLTKLVGVILPP